MYFEKKKFDFGQNNSAGVVIAALGVSRGIFWASFIGKTTTFERFLHFEQKRSRLCQKLTAWFPKHQSTCPENTFEREIKLKKCWFFSNFVFWVKKIGLWEKNPTGFVKAAFGVSRGIFWEFFIAKTEIFEWISYFEPKSSGLCQKITAGFPILQSTCPEKNLRERKEKKDDFLVILYSELKNWTLGKTVWQGLSKLHSACPEESFEHFSLEKRWFLKDFCTLSGRNPDFAKNLRQGLQNLHLRVRKKNLSQRSWKKDDYSVFLYFELNNLDFGQNNSAGVVKAAFGLSRGIFWAFFIGKTMTFESFLHFEQKRSWLCQKLTAGFPILQSTCPEKKFEREKLWKKRWFLSNFVLWVIKLVFGQNSLAGVVKASFGVSRGIFGALFIGKRMIWFLNDFCTLSGRNPEFAKNLRQGLHNLQLRVRKKIWAKEVEKKMITQFFCSLS